MKTLFSFLILFSLLFGCSQDPKSTPKKTSRKNSNSPQTGGINPCSSWVEKEIKSQLSFNINSDGTNSLLNNLNISGYEVRNLGLSLDHEIIYEYNKIDLLPAPIYNSTLRKLIVPLGEYQFDEGNTVGELSVSVTYGLAGDSNSEILHINFYFNQSFETTSQHETDCHLVDHVIELRTETILNEPDAQAMSIKDHENDI